jgi:hypothetical protein
MNPTRWSVHTNSLNTLFTVVKVESDSSGVPPILALLPFPSLPFLPLSLPSPYIAGVRGCNPRKIVENTDVNRCFSAFSVHKKSLQYLNFVRLLFNLHIFF